MKKWLMAILFGSALVLGACGGGDDGATDGGDAGGDDAGETTEASGAEDLYKQNCASCHGEDLSGGAGPDLNNAGANNSADEIKDIIVNGQGSMPAQDLPEEDAQTLADWLAEKK
ncbi:MAG TPA: cytochrome c [Bacillota bacterium]|nr:cytochrome c [Bacillota bacterium]